MKRSLLNTLAIIICAASAMAQQSDFNGWGVRAALDVNMPSKWKTPNGDKIKMLSNGVGFTAGAVYNMPFAGNFYFEPGMSLFYDTYKYDNLVISSDPVQGTTTATDPSVKKLGIRIPLTIGYRFFFRNNFNFSIYTGPELSYALSGKIGIDKDLAREQDLTTNLFDYGHRRADCGWKVGVGFPAGRWVVALEGSFGLLDMHKNDFSYHENRLSLSVGYDF